MSRCPYFKVWGREIPRRASSSDGDEPIVIKVSYCAHAQSPVTLEMAQHELGDGGKLKCAGFVRRCPLPEGVRPVPPALENIEAANPAPAAGDSRPAENGAAMASKTLRRRSGG